MPKYVDGFVFVVPKKKLAEYRKMAKEGAKMWKKEGALDYKECVGDDLKPHTGGGMKTLSFTKLVKLKRNETVWFSFITYKSKAQRDRINKKIMTEMEKQYGKDPKNMPPMPFDMRRMAVGGFKVEVDA